MSASTQIEPFEFVHGQQLSKLSRTERDLYIHRAFAYWRHRGFPYPRVSQSEKESLYLSYSNSQQSPFYQHRMIRYSPLGLRVCNAYHPRMWSVKCAGFRTPLEVFNHDELLLDALRRAVRYWKDRRPLNPNNLRRILSTYKNTKRVANFRPTVARAIYQRYSSSGSMIVDVAAGYGGRLLGSFPLNRYYVGIEPEKETVQGLRDMQQELLHLTNRKHRASILRGAAEDELKKIPSNSAELVILCPPYFARELYGSDPKQSYIRYPSYSEWISGFLDPVLRESARVLRSDGILCMNVFDTETHSICKDAHRLAKNLFTPHYRYHMNVGSVPYHRNGQRGGHRSEPLLIYRPRRR